MRLKQKIKKVLLSMAVVALLMVPATGYSWTHDGNYGHNRVYQTHYNGHRGYRHYNGYGHYRGYRYYGHGGWGGYRYYSPYAYYPSPNGYYWPGFSFYIGL